jgi:hypothetical protein
VANRNGFLAIGEPDRVRATRFLNEIMAVTLLSGEPRLAFKEQELGFAEINAQTKEIESWGSPGVSVRAPLFEERWRPTITGGSPRGTIGLEEFRKWMARAQEICQDPDLSESLVFLLEAHTHLQNSSYLESLVLSWVVIEKHLFRVWEKYLKAERFPRDRRDKLSDGFSVDSIIEVMNITGHLSLEDYQTLMPIKKIRNEIVHEGRDVTKEEAERSMTAALKTVRQIAQTGK